MIREKKTRAFNLMLTPSDYAALLHLKIERETNEMRVVTSAEIIRDLINAAYVEMIVIKS